MTTADAFTITEQPHTGTGEGATTHLLLTGEFDLAARDALTEALLRPIAAGSGVVVDLTAVTFLDSESLSALITGHNAARDAGVGFRLTNPRGTVRRVLEVTGVLGFGTRATGED